MLSPEGFENQTKVSIIILFCEYTSQIQIICNAVACIYSCRWDGWYHHVSSTCGRRPSPPTPGRMLCRVSTPLLSTRRGTWSSAASSTGVSALQLPPASGNASLYFLCASTKRLICKALMSYDTKACDTAVQMWHLKCPWIILPRVSKNGKVQVLHHRCTVVVELPDGATKLCGEVHRGKYHLQGVLRRRG